MIEEMKMYAVALRYTNWRGETAIRNIIPLSVWFGPTEWHPEPQWLLHAIDADKKQNRDFALKDFGYPLRGDPEAVRFGFDGYGFNYADNGNGSDWFARAMKNEDAQPMYVDEAPNFQGVVDTFMQTCFGREIADDKLERADRLLEEVFELLQAVEYPPERVDLLRDYVWSRDVGELPQELGGVMVTLAAFSLAHRLDMYEAGTTEINRALEPATMERIRAKQAAKPKGSALPVAADCPPVVPTKAMEDVAAERVRQVVKEGFGPEHDDLHGPDELAFAAASYSAFAGASPASRKTLAKLTPPLWPWSDEWWKPTVQRRDLVKAGALILAAIEKIDREGGTE